MMKDMMINDCVVFFLVFFFLMLTWIHFCTSLSLLCTYFLRRDCSLGSRHFLLFSEPLRVRSVLLPLVYWEKDSLSDRKYLALQSHCVSRCIVSSVFISYVFLHCSCLFISLLKKDPAIYLKFLRADFESLSFQSDIASKAITVHSFSCDRSSQQILKVKKQEDKVNLKLSNCFALWSLLTFLEGIVPGIPAIFSCLLSFLRDDCFFYYWAKEVYKFWTRLCQYIYSSNC